MEVYIIVHGKGGSQRIRCFDGRQAAMEVACILHRESGREIEVVSINGNGGGDHEVTSILHLMNLTMSRREGG